MEYFIKFALITILYMYVVYSDCSHLHVLVSTPPPGEFLSHTHAFLFCDLLSLTRAVSIT